MTKAELQKRIAQLETMNDQLLTEVQYIDQMMRMVGFTNGIETVKATAKEIIDKGLVDVVEPDPEEEE